VRWSDGLSDPGHEWAACVELRRDPAIALRCVQPRLECMAPGHGEGLHPQVVDAWMV